MKFRKARGRDLERRGKEEGREREVQERGETKETKGEEGKEQKNIMVNFRK